MTAHASMPTAAHPASPPRGWRLWLVGARPRTLPAAVVPVAVGTAVAVAEGEAVWWRAASALVVSLALQVGVNYANDYSDGIRGTDEDRVGPLRLVGSKLVAPGAVKRAMLVSFGVAAAAGATLAAVTSGWLLVVGAAAILAAWFYTGGPKPYGYAGFGEVFVFTFFGVVAVVGSAYVQTEHITRVAWSAAIPVGLLATALLVTNNLRDIPGDTTAGKNTLAVRLGDRATRTLFIALVVVALGASGLVAVAAKSWWPVVGMVAAPAAIGPLRTIRAGASGRALIAVLAATARLQLVFGLLLSAGLVLAR